MNLLRNPVFVGAMSLTAVVLLIRNVYFSPSARWQRPAVSNTLHPTGAGQTRTESRPLPADGLQRSPALAAQRAAPKPMAGPAIDTNAARWIEVPRRDPFGNRIEARQPAAQLLKLQAIWCQTGTNLAVINDQLLTEGERIFEFSVEKIEARRVWLTGPHGREDLSFELSKPESVAELRP